MRRDVEAAGWGCGALILGIVALFAAVAIGWGVLLFSVGLHSATAGFLGRSEANIQIQSGTNRIEKQQQFETLWADVRRYDEQIPIAAQSTAQHAAENLTGLKLRCVDAVEQYNALARFVTAEQFRAADLPASISATQHCGGK